MANSVVKVSDIKDDGLDDNLFLLVGEDGTVAPDQDTVENYLKQRSGPTNIQIMKINHSEKQAIDISVDSVTYMPDVVNEEVVSTETLDMAEVERNLYNFRLDHDYTPFTSPTSSPSPPVVEDEDELAQTLSILDGPDPETLISISSTRPPPLVMATQQKKAPKINLIQSITITPANQHNQQVVKSATVSKEPTEGLETSKEEEDIDKSVSKSKDDPEMSSMQTEPTSKANSIPTQKDTIRGRAKVIKTYKPALKAGTNIKKVKPKLKPKADEESEDDDSDYSDEDLDMEMEDDENDSDFEIDEVKTPKRTSRRTKSESKATPKTPKLKATNKDKGIKRVQKEKAEVKSPKEKPFDKSSEKVKSPDKEKPEEKEKTAEKEMPSESDDKHTGKDKVSQPEQLPETKLSDKKTPHKKKKDIPKPIIDDFNLFATPDIIKRVGGKEPTTPVTPTPVVSTTKTPAKITQESRGKSADQPAGAPVKNNRISLDSKIDNHKEKVREKEKENEKDKEKEKEKEKDKEKDKARNKEKEKLAEKDNHIEKEKKDKERRISSSERSKRVSIEEKSKHKDLKPENRSERHSIDRKTSSRIAAENILNTDEMPSAEDIRSIIMGDDTKSYSTSSVPMETETTSQNMGEMNLDSSGLDLDPTILDNLNNDEISEDILYQVAQSLVSNPELQNAIDKGINEGVLDPNAVHNSSSGSQQDFDEDSNNGVIQKGTQIVRPDGRIVVIPPIERPTTRSRNKKKEDAKPVFKPVHKPLDEEHVSGNELDSSNGEEEESEDDPNKLWCICNQPHNNRFMICCDTCEEWYHGKCVNITKTMGQQMEAEGREWICLFCKDPALKRPQAAARRIRKASRNSRTSTESTGSSSRRSDAGSAASVKCVVCHNQARKNSIYCSEACILAHAQGIERVVVFERATGKMLTGNKAPSAATLDQWLKEHRGYEVLKSGGRVVTAKPGSQMMQSKLKLVKNVGDHGVSLAVQKKGVNLGVLKHAPKHAQPAQQEQQQAQQQASQGSNKTPLKLNITSIKLASKVSPALKDAKSKLIQVSPQSGNKSGTISPSTKPKLVQSTLTKAPPQTTPTKPKEKPAMIKTPKTPKTKQPDPQQTATPKQQEDIRENVEKTLFEQLTNRLNGCESLKLTEDEVKNISKEIESQLFKCFGDTGQKYRNKYRSLIFNIKDAKNQTLWRRICEKSINPYELVRLSPDDLASQELAMWREREAKHQLDMIKKSELELLNCNRQYVLKTHKGEQVVEDDRVDKVDNTEMIKSLTEGSTLETIETKSEKDKDKKSSSKHSHKDRDKSRDKKSSKDHRGRRSSSRERTRKRSRSRSRSRSRDYRKDHKKHSRSKDRSRDRNKDKSREKDRHKKSHKSSKHKKEIVEEKLDKKSKEILESLRENKILPSVEERLWKHVPPGEEYVPGKAAESDSDHEPTSTVTIPTPPRSQNDDYQSSIDQKSVTSDKDKSIGEVERSTSPPPRTKPSEIWKGCINMPDVAQISVTAHVVSGDCSGLGRELASNLDIVGRISPETVWDYIGKMKCSNSKAISLIRLSANDVEEKMPYLALYSYLSSRDRLGVVKSLNKAVKDFYIYPLAPTKPIPQVLLPLNGPGFEEQRPTLLLGIIVRDKRKRPLFDMPPTPSIIANLSKKPKIEVPAVVAAAVAASHSTPSRSYTPPPPAAAPPLPAPVPAVPAPVPPPVPAAPQPPKDPRLKLPLPPIVPPVKDDEGDEPYSPGDSSPDLPAALVVPPPPIVRKPIPDPLISSTSAPITNSLPTVPSLAVDSLDLLANPQELQRQMDELTQRIEAQKSEISNMTQNIVAASTEIGTSALANIALPSNLQQILDSIKTIGENTTDSGTSTPKESPSTDLTIPLMIPKNFTPRVPPPPIPSKKDLPSDTIPLNLPAKPKIKPPSVNSPLLEEKSSTPTPSTTSVLGSLSEEDLIKKAAEMLGEETGPPKKKDVKRPKIEISLPPVPGLD